VGFNALRMAHCDRWLLATGYLSPMPFILLTNDDGIDAPGLPSFAAALSALGDVEVVVPDRERSWIGKAITRFDPVAVKHVEIEGRLMHTTTGYPADCVQLGVHTLFGRKPDIVVSGINVGYNYGTAYLQSSGTVGAALEGGIAGVPSVAFSMGGRSEDWEGWKEWAESTDALPSWVRLADIATDMVSDLLASGMSGVISVGLPDSADASTERRLTKVARAGYDKLFSKIGPDLYTHSFGDMADVEFDRQDTDLEAGADNVIAITPVDGAGFGEHNRQMAEVLLEQ
jgi:5'/3'-nucleotidase SurE